MLLTLLKSKLHHLRVTEANVHYEGSLTLDEELMEAAALHPHERVEIYNVTNGHRLATYVIPGQRGSRVVCANGAAAHRVKEGDQIILASYAQVDAEEAALHRPVIVLVDGANDPRPGRRPPRTVA